MPADQMLGKPGEGFRYAQIRLSPARLSHCMRWHGCCERAHEIASDCANRREAFGQKLIDHDVSSDAVAYQRAPSRCGRLVH